MSFTINSNISALQALGKKQAVTANNIANADSKDFKKSRVILEENEHGTVAVKGQQVNTPGVMSNATDGSLEELTNDDLGQELTDMIPTQRGYEANLKALQTQGAMQDSIIDLIG